MILAITVCCAKCRNKIPRDIYILNGGFCEDCYCYIKDNKCCTVCFDIVPVPDNEDNCICHSCEGKIYKREGGKSKLKKRITSENNHWISNQNDNIARYYEDFYYE